MTNYPMPPLRSQFLDNCGKPLVGGRVFVYEAGTLTEKTTYTSKSGDIQNTNPIILDETGSAQIFYAGFARVIAVSRCGVTIADIDNLGWSTDQMEPIHLAASLEQQNIVGNTLAMADVSAFIDDSLTAQIRADGLEIKGTAEPNATIEVQVIGG